MTNSKALQGAGSALLDARGRMFKILKGMQTVTDIPITAKFRMGIKDNMPVADRVVPKLEELVGYNNHDISLMTYFLFL